MRGLALYLLVALALFAVPAAGSAAPAPGPNGKVAFSSGRASSDVPNPLDDRSARIWVADYSSGPPQQATTLPATMPGGQPAQHRHPSWSPDHTRIVYAAGVPSTGAALWIVDLRTGAQTEFVPEGPLQDFPSWSPDGTMIAYNREGNIWVKAVDGLSAPVQLTASVNPEERPVWSPDGNTIFYNREVRAADRDVYRKTPVTPAGEEIQTIIGATDDWQPSVSPDGKRICFLRGPQADPNAADVFTASAAGANVAPFAATAGLAEVDCVWSPDGSRIMYSEGALGAGELRTLGVDRLNRELLTPLNAPQHFDGNADWATNLQPSCESKTVGVLLNSLTTIQLRCTDPDAGLGAAPPQPAPLGPDALEVLSGPTHGAIGTLVNGAVGYTPDKDFVGTDSLTFTGADFGSRAAPATVTINVSRPPDSTPPRIGRVKLSRARWWLGGRLASASRVAVGTTISFRLSEEARATLLFKRVGGRRAGSLSLSAKAGLNRVRFQGRLSRTRSLTPGRYRLVLTAQDAAGNKSAPRKGPSFTAIGPPFRAAGK